MEGDPKYLAVYEMRDGGIPKTLEWERARNSEWTKRIRPYLKDLQALSHGGSDLKFEPARPPWLRDFYAPCSAARYFLLMLRSCVGGPPRSSTLRTGLPLANVRDRRLS